MVRLASYFNPDDSEKLSSTFQPGNKAVPVSLGKQIGLSVADHSGSRFIQSGGFEASEILQNLLARLGQGQPSLWRRVAFGRRLSFLLLFRSRIQIDMAQN